MKRYLIYLLIPFLMGCNSSDSKDDNAISTNIETNNQIDLRSKNLINKVAYIPPQCYTKTSDNNKTFNPCYSCHRESIIPNYINDFSLQEAYGFGNSYSLKNRWFNLFEDKSKKISQISDEEIINYIRKSNYIDTNGKIYVTDKLKNISNEWDYNLDGKWNGYTPDCYFNFDSEGFDRDLNGEFSGWRVFSYYPFLGTFFPTNGSMDDVLIRLDEAFREDENGNFNKDIYKLNLAIVESLIKKRDVNLTENIDEVKYGVDLNKDGKLSTCNMIKYEFAPLENKNMSYVGLAKEYLNDGKVHLAGGLYPEGTEFLHTVRYIDIEDSKIKIAPRLKELRYSKKFKWLTYSDLKIFAMGLEREIVENNDDVRTIKGNMEVGVSAGVGWLYQGFIEDSSGELRPQTYEESIQCIGCHNLIGATIDSSFAFGRKFDSSSYKSGWFHISEKEFEGVADRDSEYANYLKNNLAGDEFRENEEIKSKFFNGYTPKEEMFEKLKNDISILLLPSKERAMKLNKAYKVIVDEQSFIYGRDTLITPVKNVYKEVEPDQSTKLQVIK